MYKYKVEFSIFTVTFIYIVIALLGLYSASSVLETRNTFYTLGKPSDIIESDKLPEKQLTITNS